MTNGVPQTEIAAAQAWRVRRDLTMQELADLTGYSVSKIYWAERGLKPPLRSGLRSKPISVKTWERYRKACHYVDLLLQHKPRSEFSW